MARLELPYDELAQQFVEGLHDLVFIKKLLEGFTAANLLGYLIENFDAEAYYNFVDPDTKQIDTWQNFLHVFLILVNGFGVMEEVKASKPYETTVIENGTQVPKKFRRNELIGRRWRVADSALGPLEFYFPVERRDRVRVRQVSKNRNQLSLQLNADVEIPRKKENEISQKPRRNGNDSNGSKPKQFSLWGDDHPHSGSDVPQFHSTNNYFDDSEALEVFDTWGLEPESEQNSNTESEQRFTVEIKKGETISLLPVINNYQPSLTVREHFTAQLTAEEVIDVNGSVYPVLFLPREVTMRVYIDGEKYIYEGPLYFSPTSKSILRKVASMKQNFEKQHSKEKVRR